MEEAPPDQGPLSPHPPGFHPAYAVELLYQSRPAIDRPALDALVRSRLGRVEVLGADDPDGPRTYEHPELVTRMADGTLAPAVTVVGAREEISDELRGERLAVAVAQTWNWPDARAALERTTDSLTVTDLFAIGLPPALRLGVFQKVLACVVEHAPPIAIHWIPAGKLVSPGAFERALRGGAGVHPFSCAVNVRFFNVEGTAADMIMDTLGLAAIGLPDLQCHFRGLSPTDVAAVLYGHAFRLLDQGDRIVDGSSIEGPGQVWTARHELSALHPVCPVIDLNPGPPYAAGERA